MEKELLQYKASQYLKNPKITHKFKLNYLSSLNTYLDDKNFQNKVQDLPKLKSQVITKYEKSMEKFKKEKEDRERLKKSEAGLDVKAIVNAVEETHSKEINFFNFLNFISFKIKLIQSLKISRCSFDI